MIVNIAELCSTILVLMTLTLFLSQNLLLSWMKLFHQLLNDNVFKLISVPICLIKFRRGSYIGDFIKIPSTLACIYMLVNQFINLGMMIDIIKLQLVTSFYDHGLC